MPIERQAKLDYSRALWSALAAAGVNFIPADWNAVRLAIAADPSAFGFQFIGTAAGQFACTPARRHHHRLGIAVLVRPRRAVDPGLARCGMDAAFRRRPAHDDGRPENPGGLLLQPGGRAEPDLVPGRSHGEDPRRHGQRDPQPDSAVAAPARHDRFNGWITGDVSTLEDRQLSAASRTIPAIRSRGARVSTTGFRAVARGRRHLGRHHQADLQHARLLHAGCVRGQPLCWLSRRPVLGQLVASAGIQHYDVAATSRSASRCSPTRAAPTAPTSRSRSRPATASSSGVHARPGGRHHAAAGRGRRLHRERQLHQPGFRRAAARSAVTALGYQVSYDAGIWRPFAKATWNHELVSDRP